MRLHGVAVVDSSEESRNYHNCDVHLSQYGHENKTESKKGWGSKIATDILLVLIGWGRTRIRMFMENKVVCTST